MKLTQEQLDLIIDSFKQTFNEFGLKLEEIVVKGVEYPGIYHGIKVKDR